MESLRASISMKLLVNLIWSEFAEGESALAVFKGMTMTKQHFGASHVPLSPAVGAGDFIYVSGQVPVGADGKVVEAGMEAQTRQVLDNVRAALALAGAELSDV